MRKLITAACAATMLITSFGASTLTANAAPLPRIEASASDVIQVQNRRDRHDRRDRFERRRDGHHYYNGRRGYRERRHGYRQYKGYWFPPAAFIAGAIIGGATAAPARASNRHVQWCAERYRSYRVSDNTYNPGKGPRRQCNSPYR
jgi:hypothetical protein